MAWRRDEGRGSESLAAARIRRPAQMARRRDEGRGREGPQISLNDENLHATVARRRLVRYPSHVLSPSTPPPPPDSHHVLPHRRTTAPPARTSIARSSPAAEKGACPPSISRPPFLEAAVAQDGGPVGPDDEAMVAKTLEDGAVSVARAPVCGDEERITLLRGSGCRLGTCSVMASVALDGAEVVLEPAFDSYSGCAGNKKDGCRWRVMLCAPDLLAPARPGRCCVNKCKNCRGKLEGEGITEE